MSRKPLIKPIRGAYSKCTLAKIVLKKLAITLDDARESIILITDTQSKGIQLWKEQGAEGTTRLSPSHASRQWMQLSTSQTINWIPQQTSAWLPRAKWAWRQGAVFDGAANLAVCRTHRGKVMANDGTENEGGRRHEKGDGHVNHCSLYTEAQNPGKISHYC